MLDRRKMVLGLLFAGSEMGAASDCETETADDVAVGAVEGAALRIEPLWAAAT